MDAYYTEVGKLEAHFYSPKFHHVPKEHNVAANILSNLGSIQAQVPVGVRFSRKPSIKMLHPDQNDDDDGQALAESVGKDVLMIKVEED